MRQIYSDVIQFRGSHYDFGFREGLLLKDSLIFQNRAKQRKMQKPRFTIKEREIKEAILQFMPSIWEEILGLQDALKWSINDILESFGGYQLEYTRSGCSVFTNPDYLIRNYDFHPKTYEGRFTLFQPTEGYATIGPSQRITGRMDGMNEHGLSIGYNYIHQKQPGVGFICNMVARMVLESCKNVDEALTMLKEIPHRHSFNYIVLDPAGETFVVETTPRGVEIRQSNVCTNHFDILTHENRHHLDDSFKRMDAIKRQENDVTNAYEAFNMLNNTEKGVFSKQYKNSAGTIHTAAYFPKERKVWFALGGDREPLVFDFATWLTGEYLGVKRVLGEVDTELPFLHMDENVR